MVSSPDSNRKGKVIQLIEPGKALWESQQESGPGGQGYEILENGK